jgi:hypothetical protein
MGSHVLRLIVRRAQLNREHNFWRKKGVFINLMNVSVVRSWARSAGVDRLVGTSL